MEIQNEGLERERSTMPPGVPLESGQPHIILISGPFGSGMEELGKRLALLLHLSFHNPHRLEELVSDMEQHDSAWEHLSKGFSDFFSYWLEHLHARPGFDRSGHRRFLEDTIQRVLQDGGVIAGACPHLDFADHPVFRIRVKASPAYCIQRLAKMRNLTMERAAEVFEQLEREREAFIRDLFEGAYWDAEDYDLELNSEHATIEHMLERSLEALRAQVSLH